MSPLFILFVTIGAFTGTLGALLMWAKIDARDSVREASQETANKALRRIETALGHLESAVEQVVRVGTRLEAAVKRIEAAAGVVAEDLAAAHVRADAAADEGGEAGESADAAAQSAPDPDMVQRPDGSTYRGMGK